MRLLLDTHTLLWTLAEPGRLSKQALAAITAEDSDVFVSIVSPWEMAIAKARGRMNSPDDLEDRLEQNRFELVPIRMRHVRAIESMPHHHRDPFDRMLIAQAQVDGMTLVSVDRKMRQYPVSLMPAI
ncbi:MAG TPA: type II toxin-antitoxin system VapC family toxin [Solirubrobacterales bacterium]|nr:type II toxin-antitoxin system VapC family toxin [Solirubrobacterales bacterium]